jgi:hypothetical protein
MFCTQLLWSLSHLSLSDSFLRVAHRHDRNATLETSSDEAVDSRTVKEGRGREATLSVHMMAALTPRFRPRDRALLVFKLLTHCFPSSQGCLISSCDMASTITNTNAKRIGILGARAFTTGIVSYSADIFISGLE